MSGELGADGEVLRTPDIYVVIVRNYEGNWLVEVRETSPLTTGVWPHEVVQRIDAYKDKIAEERRSESATNAAITRKARAEEMAQEIG